MIRPQPARWFEIVCAREDAFIALEALANAGCVEVEWHDPGRAPVASGPTAAVLAEYNALARRYRDYWPPSSTILAATPATPAELLADAIKRLNDWAREAEPLVDALQGAAGRLLELDLAESALREMADSTLDFAALAAARHGVCSVLFALPANAQVNVPPPVVAKFAPLKDEQLLVAVGPQQAIESLAAAVAEHNGRRARFPDWLQPSAQANLALIGERRAALVAQHATLKSQISALTQAHGLADALATVTRASWCIEHGGAIQPGDIFARVTGWTSDAARVRHAIETSTARAIATFPPSPAHSRAPLTLRNPWWAQPYEVFTRLVGMPGPSGADPSVLLAFAVPLMFGYMFGDVGQGLVLAAVGWMLRDRLPVLRLLVPGGIAAAMFGLAFGSVFTIEHLFSPLWIAPLEDPLKILAVPVLAGAILLAAGILLNAVEAWWQRRLASWAVEDGPVLIAYAGLAWVWFDPSGWVVVALALGAAAIGGAITGGGWKAAFAAIGEWVERLVQLLINTLSFARVGAFALAHAGLSSAVMLLAHASTHRAVQIAVLVIGNVLILLVEGLVVSIQTTRLILFEFFTRFFRAEGREFRPLAMPPIHAQEVTQ